MAQSPAKPTRARHAATLADVGREAGVSIMAASAVLNGAKTSSRISDETRVRILAAAEKLHYRANATARALVDRRMNAIGVATTLSRNELNQYFLEVFNGVIEAAASPAAGTRRKVPTGRGTSDPARSASADGLHEDAGEEVGQGLGVVQREHGGDVLVGPDDDHAAGVAVDGSRVEQVVGRVRAERLLVVDQAELALRGQQNCRHRVDGQVTMSLLEDGADVDHRVGTGAFGREPCYR